MDDEEKIRNFIAALAYANVQKENRKNTIRPLATLYKETYDVFVETGFTEEQAFELTKITISETINKIK